jgi:hypothetical protein
MFDWHYDGHDDYDLDGKISLRIPIADLVMERESRASPN